MSICSFGCVSIYYFGLEGGTFVLIVSVPGLCFNTFTFDRLYNRVTFKAHLKVGWQPKYYI